MAAMNRTPREPTRPVPSPDAWLRTDTQRARSAKLAIFAGPVSAKTLPPSCLPTDCQVATFNEGVSYSGSKIGSSAFSALGASLRPGVIEKLEKKATKARVDALLLLSFSAGWGLCNQALAEPLPPELRAVGLFDSYYSSTRTDIKTGILNAAMAAARGELAMVMTGSSFAGPGYLSCADSVQGLLVRIGARECSIPAGLQIGDVSPVRVRAVGGFVWADYGDRFKHVHHATIVAPAITERFLAPRLNRSRPPIADSSGDIAALGALGIMALGAMQ